MQFLRTLGESLQWEDDRVALAIFTPLLLSGYSDLRQASSASNYLEAAQHYQSAARKIPWRPDLYDLAGTAYYKAKEYSLADAAYRKAYQRHALSPDGWVAWGDVNYWNQNPTRAAEIWKQALEQPNPSEKIYSRLALIYKEQKDFATAARYFQRYVSIHLEDAPARYQLGLLLTLTDPNSALQEFIAASQLDPKLDPATQTLRSALNLASLTESRSEQYVIIGRGLALVNEWDLALAAFEKAVKQAKPWTVMCSYNKVNGTFASEHHHLLTEILKNELKFDGFLISDYDAIDEMPGDYKTQIETSVNAGMDMFMVPKKFPEMYDFRGRYAREWGLNLIVRPCPPVEEVDPTLPPAARSAARKTLGLKNVLAEFGFQGIIAGIRRDEEATRAKERVFSPRGDTGQWDFKDQPPEFWDQFNTDLPEGTHLRVHPLLHWTEIDIWHYIRREGIPVIELYFAPGVRGPGSGKPGKRYRSLGDEDITFPIDSDAATLDDVIAELEATRTPERAGRAMDRETEDAFEQLRAEGYM